MTEAGTETVEGGLDDPAELEPDQGDLELAGAEDRHSRSDWEAAAAAVLLKARRLGEDDADDAVWARLTTTTLDGIGISPLGTPDLLGDLQTAGRPTRDGPWDVRAHLALGADAKADHQTLITDLEGGVTSLWLQGCTADTDWATLLDGVFVDLAAVVLDGDHEAVAGFLTYAKDRELEPHTNLGIDAAGVTAEVAAEFADAASGAGIRAFVVDATQVHDRGASDVQELAHALVVGAAYLRSAEAAGVELARAAGLVEFRYAATDEQLVTIAKLRAARRLWDRVLAVCEIEGSGQHQHAVTSRAMLSRYDPYVNMLRTTVAAFAAGVGGADAVTVLAFDTPLGRPEVLGRRVARNTSALLVSEAHVAAVTDPAGGAYAVEKLTDDLAVAAWELFGRLEEGLDLDAEIERVVAERDQQVATRARPLTGLSEFPNLAETLPDREPAPGPDVRRWGAAFEALRADPPRSPVFLATMGTVAAHTARATFATNLLAAGGVAVDVAGATEGADDLVAAHDGQQVVCLAGTDAAYDEWGQAAATALREAGVSWVVVAGKPRDWADDSCAVGVDAIEFLTRTREKLT